MGVGRLEDVLVVEVASLMLVFMRVLGLMLFAPIFSAQALPLSFRFYLVIAITFVMAPAVTQARIEPANVLEMGISMVGELSIGMLLGTLVHFIFAALQLAGQTSGTQLGLALANVVNPQFDDQASTTAVVYATIASLIFFTTGLDREMFRALLDTFNRVPLGQVFIDRSVLDAVRQVFGQSMILAVRVAAPVTAALLLAEIAMGFVGRTVPQLNVLSVGFSLRIVLGLIVTMAAMSDVGRLFFSYAGDAVIEGAATLQELASPVP